MAILYGWIDGSAPANCTMMNDSAGHGRAAPCCLPGNRRACWRGAAMSMFGLFLGGGAAGAADLPLKAPVARAVYDWTGFYVGGHFGYGGGSFGPGTQPLPGQGALLPHSVTGLTGGYEIGYNREFANRV